MSFSFFSAGKSFDYVILSTVRSFPASKIDRVPSSRWIRDHLGDLSEKGYVTMAMTRANKGLIVVGKKHFIGLKFKPDLSKTAVPYFAVYYAHLCIIRTWSLEPDLVEKVLILCWYVDASKTAVFFFLQIGKSYGPWLVRISFSLNILRMNGPEFVYNFKLTRSRLVLFTVYTNLYKSYDPWQMSEFSFHSISWKWKDRIWQNFVYTLMLTISVGIVNCHF